MDNMPVGWDRPQEDEFALMNLGLGSPYEVVVFPNRRRARHPFLDTSGLTPHMLKCYKDLSQRGREPIRPILRRAGLEVKANYIDA